MVVTWAGGQRADISGKPGVPMLQMLKLFRSIVHISRSTQQRRMNGMQIASVAQILAN